LLSDSSPLRRRNRFRSLGQEAWTTEKYRRFDRGERLSPDWPMKYVEPSIHADLDVAARKLVEIANAVEAVQDGRIYVELVKRRVPQTWRHTGSVPRLPGSHDRAELAAGHARRCREVRLMASGRSLSRCTNERSLPRHQDGLCFSFLHRRCCPRCGAEKDCGLILCWPCFRVEKDGFSPELVAHLEQLESEAPDYIKTTH
jgi:hypothetical protein